MTPKYDNSQGLENPREAAHRSMVYWGCEAVSSLLRGPTLGESKQTATSPTFFVPCFQHAASMSRDDLVYHSHGGGGIRSMR